MNSGLRRRATFEEALYLPGPNLDLPQRIASQLIDSPYLIKKLGDDMGQTSERRADEEDMARTVDRLAREHNVPIHELRGLVGSVRPGTQFDPFSGQAEHEARAAQAEVFASVEQQRINLAQMYTEQVITRTTAAQLAQQHVDGLADIAAALRRRATSSGAR